MNSFFRSRRLRAASLHLAASAIVAGIAAAVIFRVWYPPPYSAIAGGLSLLALLVSVDTVLGPLLTAVVAGPSKPLPELRRDLAVIVIVQSAAFAYGVHTIALARPVYLSFEIDRFRVITAADVEPGSLRDAPADLQSLPWTGPKLIAAVKPSDPAEQMRSVELGLAGLDLSMIPRNWRDYASQRARAWQVARPVSSLSARYPQAASGLSRIGAEASQPVDALRFLPLMSRRESWVAVVAAPDARVVGYLPLDGFF